jgi:hypothetical protein
LHSRRRYRSSSCGISTKQNNKGCSGVGAIAETSTAPHGCTSPERRFARPYLTFAESPNKGAFCTGVLSVRLPRCVAGKPTGDSRMAANAAIPTGTRSPRWCSGLS